MYLKYIFTFLTLGLFLMARVNGYIVNRFTGQCNDTYIYLENLGKRENFNGCKMNDKEQITELRLYSYCLSNEQLATVLSYNTIERLSFTQYFVDWGLDDRDDFNIMLNFGCARNPTNYEPLSALTNLKFLDLSGVKNLNGQIMANIPISLEELTLGNVKVTQEMVDALSNLTNLNRLTLINTEINDNLDFSKFENLKKFNNLEMNLGSPYSATTTFNIQGNMLKYCKYMKKLVIDSGIFNKDSIDAFGYMTDLEEIELNGASFENNSDQYPSYNGSIDFHSLGFTSFSDFDFNIFRDLDFSSLNNLNKLTSLKIECYGNSFESKALIFNFSTLTRLKTVDISRCLITIKNK